MMLEPTMSDLLEKIPNRYLLVNIAAKRARDIADSAEQAEEPLDEKPVKIALYDIIEGRVRPAEIPEKSEAGETLAPDGPEGPEGPLNCSLDLEKAEPDADRQDGEEE